MKAKVGHKRARHAAPVRKHAQPRKHRTAARPAATSQKEMPEQVVAVPPPIIEETVAMFEVPFEYMVTKPEPPAAEIEVFEVAVPIDVDEM